MAITTAMCNSFKVELLNAIHDLDTDTLKIALIKAAPSGAFDAATTNYSDLGADEAVGTNYTAADGALIYNASKSNRAVAVFYFGTTVTSTNGDFTVVFPTPDASNAVIRIS